jgi:hypothetical protein
MAKIAVNQDHAAALALGALQYLAGDEERMMRFLALSGFSVDNLAAEAASAETQAAVLDHLCRDEALLLEFCQAAGHQPKDIYVALKVLDPHYDMSNITLPPSGTARRPLR